MPAPTASRTAAHASMSKSTGGELSGGSHGARGGWSL